jgi:hypothetical protein
VRSSSSKQPEETADNGVSAQDSLMNRKDGNEPIADSDTVHDADCDAQSREYIEAESITEQDQILPKRSSRVLQTNCGRIPEEK